KFECLIIYLNDVDVHPSTLTITPPLHVAFRSQGEHRDDPQQLVASPQHPGEIADHPVAQGLQQIVLVGEEGGDRADDPAEHDAQDRKSTRLNSSHVKISYAVFCLKKKKY